MDSHFGRYNTLPMWEWGGPGGPPHSSVGSRRAPHPAENMLSIINHFCLKWEHSFLLFNASFQAVYPHAQYYKSCLPKVGRRLADVP